MSTRVTRTRLTRTELARRLDVSLAGVDDLIAHGLKSVGRRGRAKLYRLADAKRQQRRYAGAKTTAHGRQLLDLLHAQEQAALDQFHDLHSRFVEPALWRAHWNKYKALARRVTRTWPKAMAAPGDLREILRALLYGFIERTSALSTTAQLEILDGPERPALVDAPKTIGEAKQRLMRARAAVVRIRGRVRREKWPTRDEVRHVTVSAIVSWKSALWRGWPARLGQLKLGETPREAAADVLERAFEFLEEKRFLWTER